MVTGFSSVMGSPWASDWGSSVSGQYIAIADNGNAGEHL